MKTIIVFLTLTVVFCMLLMGLVSGLQQTGNPQVTVDSNTLQQTAMSEGNFTVTVNPQGTIRGCSLQGNCTEGR